MKWVVFGIVFSIVGAVLLGFGVMQLRTARETATWPATTGVIVNVEITVEPSDDPEIPLYGVVIQYAYAVEGIEYSGNRVKVGGEGFRSSDPSFVKELVERYPEGRRAEVFYDPDDPRSAVLETGASPLIYVLLGVGALFFLFGLGAALARVRVRKPQPPAAVPGGLGAVTEASGAEPLTPSEVVLLQGQHFAGRTLLLNTTLTDGRTRVSRHELLTAMLSAALLAHEKAGTLRLETGKRDGGRRSSRSLRVVSTGKTVEWPSPSVESRLELEGEEEAWEVVHRWLTEDSGDPSARGVEQGSVLLVLRGLATLEQRVWRRTYAAGSPAVVEAAAAAAPEVHEMLAADRRERPRLRKLLAAHVARALAKRTGTQGGFEALDAWYDEAETERRKVPGLRLRGELKKIGWVMALILTVVAWALYAGALFSLAPPLQKVGLGSLLALALGYLGWLWYRARSARSEAPGDGSEEVPHWLVRLSMEFRLKAAKKIARFLDTAREMLTGGGPLDRLKVALFALPAAGLIPLMVLGSFNDLQALVFLVGLALIGGFFYLKLRAGRAITREVIEGGKQADAAAGAASAPAASADAPPAVPAAAAAGLPFELEVIRTDALPPTSPGSRAQVAAIEERGKRLRRHYRWALLVLALASTGLFLGVTREFGCSALFLLALLIVTLAVVVRDFVKWSGKAKAKAESSEIDTLGFIQKVFRYLRGGRAAERMRWEEEIVPIRPVATPLLGWAWIVTLLVVAAASSAGPGLLAGCVVVVAGYVFWMRKKRRELEARYPVGPPLTLVALRVFGSPSMERFIDLTDRWQWLGPFLQLDGPNTAGAKSIDVTRYLTGRTRAAVTGDAAQLESALAGFTAEADKQLRYPLNSIQCGDATWQEALQGLLDKADVVVMDLASFSEDNRGCVYELRQLMERIALRKVILLVDDETDTECLTEVLREAWSAMSSASPNSAEPQPVRLFHLGGDPERRPDERVQEWRRRVLSGMEENRLLAILRDAARPEDEPESPREVRWARPGLPGPLKLV